MWFIIVHPCEPPLSQEADVDKAAAEAVEVADLEKLLL